MNYWINTPRSFVPKMVVMDFDGTLVSSDNVVADEEIEALKLLRAHGIVTVIATGRSIYSLKRVISPTFPVDYVIFSSGAGVVDWTQQKILCAHSLSESTTRRISDILYDADVDFAIHEPIPNNHRFYYYYSGKTNPDFQRRFHNFQSFARPFDPQKGYCGTACQFLAILPNEVKKFYHLSSQFTTVNVIRATSPLDGKSIWMEIFPLHVSKGNAVEWLCHQLHISLAATLGIGNDYNDESFLERCAVGIVVNNAPETLCNRYFGTLSNNDHGVAAVIQHMIKT